MTTIARSAPPTGAQRFTFVARVKQRDGSYGHETLVYDHEPGTVAISVVEAGVILGIKASSVRALVCKDRISEIPRDEWPNGKCQMVYAEIPPELAGRGLISVFDYKATRGPSRYHTI